MVIGPMGTGRVGQKRISREERKQNKGDKKITDSEGDKHSEKDPSEGIRNIGGIGNGSEVKTRTGLDSTPLLRPSP